MNGLCLRNPLVGKILHRLLMNPQMIIDGLLQKKKAELESEANPRPEEEIADWFAENPDESDEIEKEKTMHEKMYQIATSRYNPFSVGGSEQIQS